MPSTSPGLWDWARLINCGAVIFSAANDARAGKVSSKNIHVRIAGELYRTRVFKLSSPPERRVAHISLGNEFNKFQPARLLRVRLIDVGLWLGLSAVWALVDHRDMHGQLGVGGFRFGLFLGSSSPFGVFGHDRTLRVETKPSGSYMLEDVGEDALFKDRPLVRLPAHHVGPVHNRYVSHKTHAHHF